MLEMRAIIDGAQTAEAIVHGAQRTFMFSVNSSAPAKHGAVDWLLREQSRRGIDLFQLPREIEESQWSLPDNNVEQEGRRLTPDFLRTVTMSLRIRDCISSHIGGPANVVELGSGLGHLARTMRLFGITKRHVMIDIPETLVFSYCFLSLNFPEAECVMVCDPQEVHAALSSDADFIFVPNFLGEFVAGQPQDLFVNTASLGEMTNDTIRHWMGLLQERINPRFVFTLNRYLNTINPRVHNWRWNENEASVLYDANWEMVNWEVEPGYTRCPYLDPIIARYVEIIARRRPDPDADDRLRRSQRLLDGVAGEDWYEFRDTDPDMTMRDNVLAPDLGMSGTLFALWDSLRLFPTARGLAMMLRYLATLLHHDEKEFEEAQYYRNLFLSMYRDEPELFGEAEWIRKRHSIVNAIPRLISEGRAYNILQAGDQYLAVSNSLGPVEILKERLGERELAKLVLKGTNLEALRARVLLEEDAVAPLVTLVAQTAGYNIVEARGQFVAISKSAGPVTLFHDRLGDRELGNMVLVGASLEEVRARAEHADGLAMPPPVSLAAQTKHYNIVEAAGRFLAVSKSVGAIELFHEKVGERELGNLILHGASLVELLDRVGQVEQETVIPISYQAGETRDYNLVEAGGRFFAILKSLGHTRLFRDRIGDRELAPLILEGSDLEALKNRVIAEEKKTSLLS